MEKLKPLIGQINTIEFALANIDMTLDEIKASFARLKNGVSQLAEAEKELLTEAQKIKKEGQETEKEQELFPINNIAVSAEMPDPMSEQQHVTEDEKPGQVPENKINFSLNEGESVPAGWTKIRLPSWLDDKFNDDEIDTLAKLTGVKEQFLAYCRKHKYAFLKTELELKTVFHIDRIQSLNSKTTEILQDVKIQKTGT
jgi:hypothetical protein